MDKVCDWIVKVGQALGDFLSWLLGFLPDDPLDLNTLLAVPDSVYNALRYVNWFVPIGTCLSIIITWYAALILYQIVRFALKAAQLI